MEAVGVILNPGDLVRLRYGGPVMIVQSVSPRMVCCCWCTRNRINRGYFHRETIELVDVEPETA